VTWTDQLEALNRSDYPEGNLPRTSPVAVVLLIRSWSRRAGQRVRVPGSDAKGRNETGPGFNLGDWVRHH
jgi:hypothetical protein